MMNIYVRHFLLLRRPEAHKRAVGRSRLLLWQNIYAYVKLLIVIFFKKMDNFKEIKEKAEKFATKYNPEGLSPFPFDSIEKDRKDLKILFTSQLPDNISGVILYDSDNSEYQFAILINKTKPSTRQQFTIAHELGHYFLHQEEIKKEFFVDNDNVLDSSGVLYRRDDITSNKLEKEANNFAASLIMPEAIVRKVWAKLQDVDDCAQVFNVSVEAMSIRLSRIGLV